MDLPAAQPAKIISSRFSGDGCLCLQRQQGANWMWWVIRTVLVSKDDELLYLKTRNCVSKTRNCVFKTRNFAFKMMNFAAMGAKCGLAAGCLGSRGQR